MQDVNSLRLDDVIFINNSDQTIVLDLTMNGAKIPNIENCDMKWALSLYGDTEPIITKSKGNGISVFEGQVIIELSKDDTKDLPTGTYEQQFLITIGKDTLRPCFGIVNIKESLKY